MIMRRIYIALLRLHPRAFRERFAEEMMGIFDEESKKGKPIRLLLDAAASILRQRLFRAPQTGAVTACADGMAMFPAIEPGTLNPAAIIAGAAMTILSFAAVSFALGHGEGPRPGFLIGTRHPRTAVLPSDRLSLAAAEPSTEIKVKALDPDAMDQLAKAYFDASRVLNALDVDKDRVLSRREIANASVVLTALDGNDDGELDAEECGFFTGIAGGRRSNLAGIERRQEFMIGNPVLAALDGDHDGRLSVGEIQMGPVAILSLDKDRDGRLTPPEVLPRRAEEGTTGRQSRISDFRLLR